MTAAERKQYYADYNNSRTATEWDSISKATQKQLKTQPPQPTTPSTPTATARESSVSFKIKNNSIFSQRVKIVDNILEFKPFELRYVGFQAGTKAFLHRGDKEDKYLFTVANADDGKTFKIFE